MAWDKDRAKDREKECACCLEIEKSVVLIICGEVDIDKFRDTLNTIVDNVKFVSRE